METRSIISYVETPLRRSPEVEWVEVHSSFLQQVFTADMRDVASAVEADQWDKRDRSMQDLEELCNAVKDAKRVVGEGQYIPSNQSHATLAEHCHLMAKALGACVQAEVNGVRGFVSVNQVLGVCNTYTKGDPRGMLQRFRTPDFRSIGLQKDARACADGNDIRVGLNILAACFV